MISKKIAVIGGGASGIIASLVAKKDDNIVDLYEKNSTLGKKILISGNGRCNIHNENISKNDFFGEDINFAAYPLREFGFLEFKRFCQKLGLFLKVQDDGKVYPCSNQSKSVMRVFENSLKDKGVNILLSKDIKNIKKQDKFLVDVDGETKIYDKILISCGSKSAPKVGGNSFGYDIAKNFGHDINNLYPALVQLDTKKAIEKILSGVKIKSKVTVANGIYKGVFCEGDLLFTKYGLSGFAILDISLYISKALSLGEKTILSIDLLPDFDRGFLEREFLNISKRYPSRNFIDLLVGFLPVQLSKVVAKRTGVDELSLSEVNIKNVKKSIALIKDWRFEIEKTHGFDYAEVCGGGVKTSQINSKTMESKLTEGLYFAGEVLDITGKRGGYNLAFAFASGYIAGKSISMERKY